MIASKASKRFGDVQVVKEGGQAHVFTEFGARSARSASGAGVSPGVCDVVGLSPTYIFNIFQNFHNFVLWQCFHFHVNFSIFNFIFLVNLLL